MEGGEGLVLLPGGGLREWGDHPACGLSSCSVRGVTVLPSIPHLHPADLARSRSHC